MYGEMRKCTYDVEMSVMGPWLTRSQGWNHKVGQGSFIVFQRLNRFYKTFLVLSGLVSALSAATLQFQEFHPTTTELQRAAEGFFVSSTSTAVISAMLATMLLFRFEAYEEATRKELLLAWSPLVILDWSILSFLGGLLCWYKDKVRYDGLSLIRLDSCSCRTRIIEALSWVP